MTPAEKQEVIWMFLDQGLSYKEIAERTGIEKYIRRNYKTTKELRTMLIKLIYKILKKLIDNCDKFYLEETDPDVIEAKELLGRVEKAMKAKGDDANAHQ